MKHLSQCVTEALLTETANAKDIKRIGDIIAKADGDEAKELRLATTMTKLIKDTAKAKRRWEAAVELLGNGHAVTQVFKDALTESQNEDAFDWIAILESTDMPNDTVADRIYQQSLGEDFWKEISERFPEYNNPKSDDHKKATKWLCDQIGEWWPLDGLDKCKTELQSKISAGIS